MLTSIDPALARRAAGDGVFLAILVIVAQVANHVAPAYGTDLGYAAVVVVGRYLYLRWRRSKV